MNKNSRYFSSLQAFNLCADYPKVMSLQRGAHLARRALASAALGVALPASAFAAPGDISALDGGGFVPGEVVVRYEPGTGQGERRALREQVGAELQRRLGLPRAELLELSSEEGVKAAVAELNAEPDIAFAEPNFRYRVAITPDDPQFNVQWPLNNEDDGLFGLADADVDAPEAWNLETGDEGVVVAVVDTGITLAHPDLDDNLWTNPDEEGALASNGLDDGGNSLVDDDAGWDFVSDDSDPTDEEGHGTHVAGILGAEGNNATGIAGVTWDASLMPLRACDALGACDNADIAEAFAYAGAEGADVVNASLSGDQPSDAQQAAIAASPGTLFVVAAGNDGTSNAAIPRYPCNYQADNLVCVAATNDRDGRADFSNFGPSSVDLAAPGGSADGSAVTSTYMADRMSDTFQGSPLSADWATEGTPDSWDRTDEPAALAGGKLTDSPGGQYAPGADNSATFGAVNPIDLGADTRCNLRYDLALDVPDPDDRLWVQGSADGTTFTNIQGWTGVGSAKLTPSISGFAGSPNVWIRFRLQADGDANVGDGAHVDNVRVRCASGGYAPLKGTSMAAPHVSGAAALMLAHQPTATVAQLRDWLLDGIDLLPALDGVVASGGRLNLHRALRGAGGEDIRRPDTSITSGPAMASRATSAGFSFSATEPAIFQCSLDAAPFGACASPASVSGLKVGDHGFRVRAVDMAGNVDPTPASHSFTVIKKNGVSRACLKAKRKLKRAGTAERKRELRKLVKRKCRKAGK